MSLGGYAFGVAGEAGEEAKGVGLLSPGATATESPRKAAGEDDGAGGDWRQSSPQMDIPLPPTGRDVQKGTVEKIFATFGFIFGYNGGRYFFHFGTCVTKPELLKAGDEVEYLVGPDKKSGRMHAQRVYRRPSPYGLPELLERRIPNPAAAPAKAKETWRHTGKTATNTATATNSTAPHSASTELTNDIVAQIAILLRSIPLNGQSPAEKMSKAPTQLIPGLIGGGGGTKGVGGGGGGASAAPMKGILAAVLDGDGFLIEYADHSQLVYATRASMEVPEPRLSRGDELSFHVQRHAQGSLTEVYGLRKLPPYTLTADSVVGAEELKGQVATEMQIGAEGKPGGEIQVIRSAEDPRPARRYAFSLLSLDEPRDVGSLRLGTLVSFRVIAEGSERRASHIRLAAPVSPPLSFVPAPKHWTSTAPSPPSLPSSRSSNDVPLPPFAAGNSGSSSPVSHATPPPTNPFPPALVVPDAETVIAEYLRNHNFSSPNNNF